MSFMETDDYGAFLFMSKKARHKAILDLLGEGPVESQDFLQQRLERKGFEVGQATLSRDIHELKLVKGPDGYQRAGETLGADSAAFGDAPRRTAFLFVETAKPRTCWS